MKIIRYLDSRGQLHYGSPQDDGAVLRVAGDLYDGFQVTSEPAEVRKLLAPVSPTVFLCIGLNYRRHAEEVNAPIPDFPILFMKGPNAVQHPGDPIRLPSRRKSAQVDYECELAVVIGRTCTSVAKRDALQYVLGYTCANDVSARDWQRYWGGGQWCCAKTFDTFAPLGPWLVMKDEIPDPNALRIRTLLNGDVMQDSNTSDMLFDVPTLIEFLSGSTTLLPGTVILTGTPAGIGMARTPPRWLKAGDAVTIDIEKIGQLTNPVLEENGASNPITR